jgi:hypothetical protein
LIHLGDCLDQAGELEEAKAARNRAAAALAELGTT